MPDQTRHSPQNLDLPTNPAPWMSQGVYVVVGESNRDPRPIAVTVLADTAYQAMDRAYEAIIHAPCARQLGATTLLLAREAITFHEVSRIATLGLSFETPE